MSPPPPSVYLALPPDLAKHVAVAVAVAEAAGVQVAGMEVEEGEAEIETGAPETMGKAVAKLSQGPWRGPERFQSRVTASDQK